MKDFISFFVLIICLFSGELSAQEIPPIQNYSPTDYGAENQNWSISQSADKLIYIANNKGLLEYNGATWKLYPTPNETTVRSVNVVKDRIYMGCYMDFGYWKKDTYGVLNYTSLAKEINAQLPEDEEFWNIIALEDWVLFQSFSHIFMYNSIDKSVKKIDSDSKIINMYKVENSIYFQRLNNGIYKIENGEDVLVTNNSIIKNSIVINVFSKDNSLLIQTRDKGFYLLKDNKLTKWNISTNDLLSKVSVYNSIELKDGSFVLGTISNGLIYLNNNGDLQFQITKAKGLLNNTVLSLFEDVDTNIWLGLDNGVSNINLNSPVKIYNDDGGRIGSVYTTAIYNGNLYLGSNQGLFYKNLEGEDDFELISGTQGQVWCLKEIDETLFCGHDSGTFIINDTEAEKISNYQGAWDIKRVEDENLLLQGNYDGLYILEKKNNSWKVRNKIKNFNNSSRYFVEMPNNEIFVNHEYKGVFKVKVDANYTQALDVTIDSIIKGANSCVFKYNEDLLYSFKEGIYKYDTSEARFFKDSILSAANDVTEFVSGKLVQDNKTNNVWNFSSSHINLISPGELTNTPKIRRIPLAIATRNDVIGYENVLQLNENNYLLGNNSGYYTLDINKVEIKPFVTYINSITSYDRIADKGTRRISKNLDGNFKSDEHTIEISFYTPEYYKYLETEYQYQVVGIYDEWSEWSRNSIKLFENLPHGDYIFKVRAKIGDKISNNIASYSFTIEKPWYTTNLMLFIYLFGLVLFLLFMHKVYTSYYRNQREMLIVENKRELELAKVQNENDIINFKNEQLQVDFKNKSKELAASTMSMIRKNELLTTIKNELNSLQDKAQIKPVINIIDKSLKQNQDWELFQEAFNNADSGFLKKIKTLHPSLTPNDLKLCAYLRLNLSSKEMAPLLNISSRSVEIKRYRLRKKLKLSHEENLVNYIIEL
jgi:DNA-binding CsgD family transcriptional regulator